MCNEKGCPCRCCRLCRPQQSTMKEMYAEEMADTLFSTLSETTAMLNHLLRISQELRNLIDMLDELNTVCPPDEEEDE